MEVELQENYAEVGGTLYVIQGILAVNPNNPKWHTLNHVAFQKGNVLFVQTEEGKALMERLDTPPNYMGGRFPVPPSFTSLKSAQEFLEAVKEGGWDEDRPLRIVRHEWWECVEKEPEL